LFIGGLLAAQTPTAPTATTPAFNLMIAAQQVRSDMVAGIVKGSEPPDAALARLKGLPLPMKVSIDPTADFGYAAIDVGHRLMAAGRPAEAEAFFRAAERALAAVVLKTPDTQAWDKAQILQQLSLIRGRYLKDVVQAKADLDQAMALQPNDPLLRQLSALLVKEHGNPLTGGTH
jgi:hypothetical protein